MDQNQLPLSPQIVDEPQENVFAGAVGAFLFALAGGIVWFILYLLGFLAAISGIVGVVCAINEELEDSPENLNNDPYGAWIIKVENITGEEELLSADDYEAFCAEEG